MYACYTLIHKTPKEYSNLILEKSWENIKSDFVKNIVLSKSNKLLGNYSLIDK